MRLRAHTCATAVSPESRRTVLRIGLTGGIGSGKSVVADEFRQLGVPVIDTDEIARELVLPGSEALREITRTFGREVLHDDGTLDRAKLRNIVFSDGTMRHALETILHPRIRAEVGRRVAALTAPYCVVVIPLLLESGSDYHLNRVLVVNAPVETRVERLMRDRGLSRSEIADIMAVQATDDQRQSVADDFIENNGSRVELRHRVADLDRRYRQ